MKLVELPPRILQVAQGFFVVFLDFLPNARAIHPHERATVVGRMGLGDGLPVSLRFWGTAFHRSRPKVSLCRHQFPAWFLKYSAPQTFNGLQRPCPALDNGHQPCCPPARSG